jgi:transposase
LKFVFLNLHTLFYTLTAKANNLKPFDYVQHLLEEIPKHMNDKDCSFLEDLLPWSEKLPAGIRKA